MQQTTTGAECKIFDDKLHSESPVASLRLVSPGAATDGVTYFS